MKTFRSSAALFALMVVTAALDAQPNIYPYCPQPYPRYYGYGVSSPNYYGGQPPYLMGGPAYGYTYPYPWQYSPYPPGPTNYAQPPYYAYMQPPMNYQAMYYPRYTQPGTTNAATTKTNSYSSPAAKETKPTAKGTPLPGKELPPASPKTTAKEPPPPPAAAAKKSAFRRLFFW